MKKILLMIFLMLSSLSAEKKDVTVSILPQKYFVEKIAGDKINVNVMVKPGFSPATYEPKTSQMKKLSTSLAYFGIDVPFEDTWLKKFQNANKNMLIVHTSDGIKKIEMAKHEHHDEHDTHKEEHHDGHDEHKEEKHDDHDEHEGLDPHVWTDPLSVKIQAKNIYETLLKVDSENGLFYKKNYESFLLELDVLHEKIDAILKPYKNKAFMVFHPSWGYFAKRYSLEQVAIESEGKEPKPKELVELIKDAKEHNIKIVFVAPQFSQNSAKTIAKSINGTVISIDTLSLDWDNNLIKTAEVIANTYK
jgi:zinc transport system substrate-binding protein